MERSEGIVATNVTDDIEWAAQSGDRVAHSGEVECHCNPSCQTGCLVIGRSSFLNQKRHGPTLFPWLEARLKMMNVRAS